MEQKTDDKIHLTLVEIYKAENGIQNLLRFYYFLDQNENQLGSNEISSPFWRSLEMAFKLKSISLFKNYADRIVQDTFESKIDQEFQEMMYQIFESIKDVQTEAEISISESYKETITEVWTNKMKGGAFVSAWNLIDDETKFEICKVIIEIGSDFATSDLYSRNRVVALINKAGNNAALATLAAIRFTFQYLNSYERWKNGEISGKRLTKHFVEGLFSAFCGITGGLAIASVTSAVVGSVTGVATGMLLCGTAGLIVSDNLLRMVFGIPKCEELENAFKFLGVGHDASVADINDAYKMKCLEMHPDKGGNIQDFYLLQKHWACIKLAKERQVVDC